MSHPPEKQVWKGHVLTPSYLLLLDQGKHSLPFLIRAAELSVSCCRRDESTFQKEELDPGQQWSPMASCNRDILSCHACAERCQSGPTVVRDSPGAAKSRRFSMQRAHVLLWQAFPLCQRLVCSNWQKPHLPWPPSTTLNKPSRDTISQPVSIPYWHFRVQFWKMLDPYQFPMNRGSLWSI